MLENCSTLGVLASVALSDRSDPIADPHIKTKIMTSLGLKHSEKTNCAEHLCCYGKKGVSNNLKQEDVKMNNNLNTGKLLENV